MGGHDELFDEYVEALRQAKAVAELWWRKLEEHERATHGSAGSFRLARRWPCGPASHPRVLAVVLEFSRRCEELNQTSDEVISPYHLVGEWLVAEDTRDLAEFMDALQYWPMHLR